MSRIRLDSLRMSGFKSFPDDTELSFPGLVTAVVGPNGVGKSNIVDALLWVLGEQSPSLMRLEQMGDVVFNGAKGRRPAGSAEVRLRLTSDDGRWSEQGGRLELSRRVFRDGPSEYRLNGRRVRLRDVVDELAAIGLGIRSYAVIEQGRVGQVLSARPLDRRVLIEEAAGITQYKVRRHEAELKLERTRQNLLRLEDVVEEVDRSLRRVKRQAAQARRHERLVEELRGFLRRVRRFEAEQLDRDRSEVRRRRALCENEVAAAASTLAGVEADETAARRRLDEQRSETETVREEVARLLASCERAEAFLERSTDLLDELRQARQRALTGAEAAAERRREHAEAMERADERLRALEEDLDSARSDRLQQEAAEEAAGADLQAASSKLVGRREEVLRTLSRLTETRNRLREQERDQDRLAYTVSQLEHERENLEKRRTESLERLEKHREEAATAARRLKNLQRERGELETRRDEAAEESARIGGRTDRLGHELWELRHRLTGAERELARRATDLDELNAVVPWARFVGRVSDFLDPDPGRAEQLDRVWREWLDLPVVDAADLEALTGRSVDELDRRLRVAVRTTGIELPVSDPPEGVAPLWPSGGAANDEDGWLAAVLPPAYLAPDIETALRAAEQQPDALVLIPNGTVVRGATVELPTRGGRLPGVLALTKSRNELAARIARTEAALQELSSAGDEITGQLADLDGSLETLSRDIVGAEQEDARAQATQESTVHEASRLEREIDAVEGEIERTAAERERVDRRREQLTTELEDLQQRGDSLEREVGSWEAEVEKLREAAAEVGRELERARAQERLASERVDTARETVARLEDEAKREELQEKELREEAEAGRQRIESIQEQVVTTRTRLAEEQGLLAGGRERERSLAEAESRLAKERAKLETRVAARRREHQAKRDELHELQVEETRLTGEWDRLQEQVGPELGIGLAELLESEAEAATDEEIDSLRARAEEAREKIDRLGPVNLLALEEAGELEERSEFLHDQRSDLVESVRSIEATIRDIDETCLTRFIETFAAVNEVLRETFAHLFGGGTARLELVDEDDPLSSGIDITAQPPGKKIQSVQLLSGGEKALTALALLVSLFRIKPSPFCILDEVDAPLDDANVERLNELVREMTEHTQFLLVTHNRRTMMHSDVLYGVTMEDPGVSKIVSVRLEDT